MTVNWNHPIVRWFIGVLAVGLTVWLVFRIIERQHTDTVQFKHDAKVAHKGTEAAHRATEAARANVARVDTVTLPGRIRWRTVHDKAIADSARNPGAAVVAHAADTVIVGDTVRLLARDSLIRRQDAELDSTKRELQVWKRRPGAPRIQLYGEGLYDVLNQVPVARAGLDVHIVGPLSVSTAGECAIEQKPCRVTAGIRFNFQ